MRRWLALIVIVLIGGAYLGGWLPERSRRVEAEARLATLERQLRLNFPELLKARVTVWLPNRVYVELVERTPAIVWNQDGGYTWIDESGVAFRPRGAGWSA